MCIHPCTNTHMHTQALFVRMEKRPSVSNVHILLITRLNDSMVCAYPRISHYKVVETQTHKSKVTALQLHNTQRSEVDSSWCLLSVAAYLTLVWKVMHCCCTFIHIRSTQLPWYTAGPQHLLSPQHEGKIHICPSSFASFVQSQPSRCCCSISLMLWGSQKREGIQITMGSNPRPPIISIPHLSHQL